MTKSTGLTNATGAPVADNTNILTAGPHLRKRTQIRLPRISPLR
jgi:hypothetical protein